METSFTVKQTKQKTIQASAIIKQANKVEYAMGIVAAALEKLGSAEDLPGELLIWRKLYWGQKEPVVLPSDQDLGKNTLYK